MPAPFPDERSLCERCGYPLRGRGLSAGDACPECGLPVDSSHPRHRTGPPWQNRLTPRAWLATVLALTFHAKATFRAMRIDGSNLPSRLFLVSIACLVALGWGAAAAFLFRQPALFAWLEGMAAATLVFLLTYLEAAGVAYFSRQRGWRVGWRTAERVAAYASLGWLPAAAALFALRRLGIDDRLAGTVFLTLPLWRLVVWSALGGLAILGFETLVWLGVRQLRYANRE